ncbi:protein suppressor 2 of zeste [Drosophila kikkawai]|uniref:Protein suppressor 2 of zeste n=1 Tax=Drosophila kikkawai TaxID=30033 RepID=A0A6P4J9I3_DROKI|nr:protein suppressor 2 of zeste [Drosophila kikkawai]XP_017031703.1 protein suppressor 2 of zeste [Drosophila kikkawai]XP_017031704.1 protein suppressor 2 of zeste [Drosophila kikkawai]XP_017031706.1 protein suppressor 2 of zeste [Drosophila kikkawai]
MMDKKEQQIALDAATMRASRDIRQFHDLITCGICRGYMIDPTTVDTCYHTYCRSCILKHLLRMVYCPDCKASGGKEISETNLRSDDTLRSLIFKLVPGLYQRECKELEEFEKQHEDLVDENQPPREQEFFTATELISLSLEYHPAMLDQCGPGEVPPIIYLQCPAGLRVELLKRFLCSKYNIEAENKLVEVEVTYEDEVLPSHFTLMDVGYCYNWSRQSPMAFCYRILLHESERTKNDENNLSRINQDIEPEHPVPRSRSKSAKSVTFAEDLESEMESPRSKTGPRSKTSPKVSPQAKNKRLAVTSTTTSMTKRELELEPAAVSSFKSLRSNDMRYSDYAVSKVKSEPGQEQDHHNQTREQPLEANTNIVVSIPPSQLGKSYVDAEDFELKTANRKGAAGGHLPKLKIELTSMRSKLSMPMSAGPRLEDTSSSSAASQQLDLETYAKNIGLKPIEQPSSVQVPDSKYSPNASPMSSCSSSTNGSSCSLGTADASTSTGSSSSHRKRKKKHSKEPKDANGKRKKLHAEISSQTDGKMKVKITTKHKVDLKRSHSLASASELALQQLKLDEKMLAATTTSEVLLNRTLGEEARSISSLVTGGAPTPPPTPTAEPEVQAMRPKEVALPTSPPLPPSLFKAFTPTPTTTAAAGSPAPATSSVAQMKPKPTPQQQQLQPVQPQSMANKSLAKPPLSNNNNRKPGSGHFVVPQAPSNNRNMHHMQRYLSTPSSIASAANKQPKRSLSLDESHPAKQARLNHNQAQAMAMSSYAAKFQMQPGCGKTAAASYLPNPQRLYGPEMVGKPAAMPLLCPASLSLSLPSTTMSSGNSVTITARPRTTPATGAYAFSEANNMSHVPALEIVRLPSSKQQHQQGQKMTTMPPLMGPPTALPKHQGHNSGAAKRSSQSPPMPLPLPMTTIPTIVKSPPLSVALSGQRSSNSHSTLNPGKNSNNAAYRTSPPALINLRNTAPSSFPSKSSSSKPDLANSKKSPPAVAPAKANGLDKSSKTSLREFRPATGAPKDADILDLSANPGRNSSSLSSSSSKAPTSPRPEAAAVNSSNSLEAALNKIKQNISANSNGGGAVSGGGGAPTTTSTSSSSGSSSSNGTGDDLQNLHMLSESATAREKISIAKAGNNNNNSSSNNNNNNSIFEGKPKNANAVVRPQNASVRSIPNPSALAFRNQPVVATPSAATTSATISKPLTVRAEETRPKMSTGNTGLLSPTSSSSSTSGGGSAATSPRALTKKPTTIDQVAANLNIRAEAKAAALAEEAPPVPSCHDAAKSPELAKTTTAATAPPPAAAKEPKETAITVSAASTLLPESLSKPPVQIAATDTLAPVASSA